MIRTFYTSAHSCPNSLSRLRIGMAFRGGIPLKRNVNGKLSTVITGTEARKVYRLRLLLNEYGRALVFPEPPWRDANMSECRSVLLSAHTSQWSCSLAGQRRRRGTLHRRESGRRCGAQVRQFFRADESSLHSATSTSPDRARLVSR